MNDRSRPKAAPEVIAATTSSVAQTADDPAVPAFRPRSRRKPSEYVRKVHPRETYVQGRRLDGSWGVQTALDIDAPNGPKVVRIEVGEKFTAWVWPASVIDDLGRLGIAYMRDYSRGAWAIPKIKVSDLLAALDADHRRVELIEVSQ